jgi:hypothetical protein
VFADGGWKWEVVEGVRVIDGKFIGIGREELSKKSEGGNLTPVRVTALEARVRAKFERGTERSVPCRGSALILLDRKIAITKGSRQAVPLD